ncbi:MAG TPA: hypothetical protein HPP56_09320 [Nitrospirae bacterium]|nr:hypothetical protein [Nitrospirota bacterium]
MKIYLIDGNAYFYRSFHAIRVLANSKGIPTNAVFGFVGLLFKLIFELKAKAVVAVFDSKEPTDRHSYYPQYKANRPPMPEELIIQVSIIKDFLKALSVKILQIAGVEADDIIGTIANNFYKEGHEILILSGDKDFFQLVNDRIKIYDSQKDTILDSKYVIEKYSLEPLKIVDLMALTGDSIDNIPGVKGIGEKRATELIRDFSDIDNLINRISEIRNNRIKRLIQENVDNIRLSKRLSQINCNVSIKISLDEIMVDRIDWDELKRLITEYELRSFIKYLPFDDNKLKVSIINDERMLINFLFDNHINTGVKA